MHGRGSDFCNHSSMVWSVELSLIDKASQVSVGTGGEDWGMIEG